ncbi:kinetochore complex Sim4 subunit Fta1-domain-containing protein [Xylariaceae sp. FL0804]|nr:kinetochore complex Sim4 subunit Fta1-domain-containing protein [Xylariaceae sp. FL0804]
MPRGRPKRAAAPAASPGPPVSPDDRRASTASTGGDGGGPPRFLNTTFSTYRASPLHVGNDGNGNGGPDSGGARLALLSRRLRDTLVGDVVRGVRVGLATTTGGSGAGGSDAVQLGRAGALERVEWRWVAARDLLGSGGGTFSARAGSEELGNEGSGGDDDAMRDGSESESEALCLELDYENANYAAFLIPELDDGSGRGRRHGRSQARAVAPSWMWGAGGGDDAHNNINSNNNDYNGDDTSSSAFRHLPLLLLRMPAALRSVVVDFLAAEFDCRISPLRLGTRTLVQSWEAWLGGSGSGGGGNAALRRDVTLTLGFHSVVGGAETEGADPSAAASAAAALKTLDVSIPADEVRRFARAGARAARQQQRGPSRPRRRGGGGDADYDNDDGGEEGWGWRSAGGGGGERDDADDANNAESETGMQQQQPFTTALARYLDAQLALDLFHPSVRVVRVVCEAFHLSEYRVKVLAAVDDNGATAVALVARLARRAAGGRARWGWSGEAAELAALGRDVGAVV